MLKLAERGFDIVLTYRGQADKAQQVVTQIDIGGAIAALLSPENH